MKCKGPCAVCGNPGTRAELIVEKNDASFAYAFYYLCQHEGCIVKAYEEELRIRGPGWRIPNKTGLTKYRK